MGVDWDKVLIGPIIAVFGDPVASYTPAGANAPVSAVGGSAITGVFDEAYIDQNGIDGPEANTAKPVLGVQLSQFSVPPAQDDVIQIAAGGTTYIVRDVRPDGKGWALLLLQAMS